MMSEERNIKNTFLLQELKNEPILYKRWTQYCLVWYIKKANRNKFMFYFLSILTMFFPLINTLFQNTAVENLAVSWGINKEWLSFGSILLSMVVSLAGGLLALFNFREQWNLYRTAAEKLKMEYVEFESKEIKTEKDIELYLSRINCYMQKIHQKWKEVAFAGNKDSEQRQETENSSVNNSGN